MVVSRSAGSISKKWFDGTDGNTITPCLVLFIRYPRGFFYKRTNFRRCAGPRHVELAANLIERAIELIPFWFALEVVLCGHAKHLSFQISDKNVHGGLTGQLISWSTAKAWKRAGPKIADVMLGQFRNLGFKRNSAAASMVDGKLDAVGNQNPADALVFFGVSHNGGIAVRVAFDVGDMHHNVIFQYFVGSQSDQFAGDCF